MDLFLSLITLFMVANMAIVFTLLRRVDLNNSSVREWEQTQYTLTTVENQPVYSTTLNSELAQ